jgi:hypothetical protein
MKKILLIIFVCVVFVSCLDRDVRIRQSVYYSYDEYRISTWCTQSRYKSVVYTYKVNELDSLKKAEFDIAKVRIEKLNKLN